jgi:copper chaperone CopZ
MALELFQTIIVEGMTCPHCEANVARNLTKLDGIDEVVADRSTAQVKISGSKINLDETSHENYFSHRRMIIGEFHLAIKKQIINR